MDSSELAFYSTDELIAELVRRRTFLGVVVHSQEGMKNGQWGDERTFKVHFNGNLGPTRASRLLDRVASYMDINLSEGEF
jgi:hypothetical protein